MPHAHHKQLQILLKRAYEEITQDGTYRVLVDRLWPRGRSKEELCLDQWARDLAPSADLRKWFGHDPKRWETFQSRYRSELDSDEKQQKMRQVLIDANGRKITLIYGAKDQEHNQAVVLRDVLLHLHRE